MCLVSKAQSGRERLFSKYLFPTKLSVGSTTQLNSSDEDPFNKTEKQYQSILDGLTQNVSTKLILAFSKFLKQKTFGVAIKLFSDSTI